MKQVKSFDVDVQLQVIKSRSAQFNSKLVFGGLRKFLKSSGYEATSVATSLGGRGGEIATRLLVSPLKPISETTRIRLEILPIHEPDQRFNCYLAFPTVEDLLVKWGIEVKQREKTSAGVGGSIVVRAKVTD